MHAKTLAKLVVTALEDVKATDVVVMDVRKATSFTDFMIVASGRSSRQVQAMADKIIEAVGARGIKALGVEGKREGEWVLIDLGDVVVHAMQSATRAFYQLEKLWGDRDEQLKALRARAVGAP